MEIIILALSLPFFALSLWLTLGLRHQPTIAAGLEGPDVARMSFPLSPGPMRRVVPWLAGLGLVAAVFLLLPTFPFGDNLLRLLTLSRYGLLAGLFLVGLVPLAVQGAPGLLANGLVLRSPWHLLPIACMSVLVGSMVLVVCRVEELCAPARFPLVHALELPDVTRPWLGMAAVAVLCLPIPLACARFSHAANLPGRPWVWRPWVFSGVMGLAAGLFLIFLAVLAQAILLSPDVTDRHLFPLQPAAEWLWQRIGAPRSGLLDGVERGLASLLDADGYSREGGDGSLRLAPGHAQMIAAMAGVLAVYVLCYLSVKAFGVRAVRATETPPLLLVLLLLLLLTVFLQGAAFALDRYWIPASLATALFSFALYQFLRTDHLFSLGWTKGAGGVNPALGAPPSPVVPLSDVAAKWRLPLLAGKEGHPQRTLVAVTASGGGIQAAAWTTRVLVGLHELYGDDFARSICLLSAVSGGSVGAMYYLDAWQCCGPPLPDKAWQYPPQSDLPPAGSICDRAMASSLEATVWGLVFPDLLRILLPPLVSKSDDRGARIEEAWRAHMIRPDIRMTDWITPIAEGSMPVPVFNATLVETGQRFLACPVLGPPSAGPPTAQSRQLFELYPDAAPLVSTMVRLSATFPFVSPISRPERYPNARWPLSDAYHFADGGYVDNEGMVTVIHWLYALTDSKYLATRTFDRILLIRLMPFPSSNLAGANLDRGWFYATLGPIDAITNVRTASQLERNELAVRLFTDAAQQRGVPVRSVVLRFDAPGAGQPPLSWMLTDLQKAAVDQAWRRIADPAHPQEAIECIDDWFPRAPRQ